MIVTLSEIDHILKRPQTYCGDTSIINTNDVMINDSSEFVQMKLEKNNLYLKLFDEIIMNAVDNIQRSIDHNENMSYIKVNIVDDCVSVENDGYMMNIDKIKLNY